MKTTEIGAFVVDRALVQAIKVDRVLAERDRTRTLTVIRGLVARQALEIVGYYTDALRFGAETGHEVLEVSAQIVGDEAIKALKMLGNSGVNPLTNG